MRKLCSNLIIVGSIFNWNLIAIVISKMIVVICGMPRSFPVRGDIVFNLCAMLCCYVNMIYWSVNYMIMVFGNRVVDNLAIPIKSLNPLHLNTVND